MNWRQVRRDGRSLAIMALAAIVSAYLARRGFTFSAGIVWVPAAMLMELGDDT